MLSFQEIKEGQIRCGTGHQWGLFSWKHPLPVLKRSGGWEALGCFGHNIPAGLETSPAKHYTGLDLDQWGWGGCEHQTNRTHITTSKTKKVQHIHTISKNTRNRYPNIFQKNSYGSYQTKIWPVRNDFHQVTLKLLEHLDGLIKLLASEKETWLRRVCATRWDPWDWNFLTRHHKTSPFLWDFATGNHIIFICLWICCFNIN